MVQELIDHAAHYGSYSAVADHHAEQVAWNSVHEGASETHITTADPVTGEVSGDILRHELGDPTAAREAAEEARASLADEEPQDPGDLLDAEEDDDGDL